MTKLAIITTEYLKNFTERSLAETGLSLNYELYIYSSFSDITKVYGAIPDKIRGVVTSGRFAAETIRRARPGDSRAIVSFDADDAGIYWLLMQLMRSKNFDPARVYIDFFDVMGINLEEFIRQPPKTTISDQLDLYMEGMTLDRLMQVEEFCTSRHCELWRKGKADILITKFSSIPNLLADRGVPVRFAYPSLCHIKETCLRALQEVQINNLRQNLLAVVDVTASEKGRGAAGQPDENLKKLAGALDRFKKANMYDFLLTPVPQGYEIFTSRKVVGELTGNGRECKLQDYLRQNLKFPVSIGYGIGNSMYQAHANAVVANREASLYRDGSSCLINEKDEMAPRLESRGGVVIKRETTPSLRRVSKKSGLSPFTIQKIIAIAAEMENHRLTSRDIAGRMGITRRSANRFLSALIRTKTARVVAERSSTTKGRPERIYQISVPG